mgnify:CR=1 FL=1
MLPRERLEITKQMVIKDKKVYVSKLSEKFDVTEETIRRDLEKLEIEGVVTRTYGGAILNTECTNEDIPFIKRARTNQDCKQKIAMKVIGLFEQGTTLVADSSSTVVEVIKLIKNRSDMTVITNSVEVFQELNQFSISILSTGGSFNKNSLSFQGPVAKDTVKKYNVDIALVSCKGMDINKGILESNEAEVELKKVMIKQADKVILLVDSSKFDKTSFVQLYEYKDIDCIVTDKEPNSEWLEFFSKHDIEVIY